MSLACDALICFPQCQLGERKAGSEAPVRRRPFLHVAGERLWLSLSLNSKPLLRRGTWIFHKDYSSFLYARTKRYLLEVASWQSGGVPGGEIPWNLVSLRTVCTQGASHLHIQSPAICQNYHLIVPTCLWLPSSSACYRQAGLICDFLDLHVSRFQGSTLLCNLSFLMELRKLTFHLSNCLL